MASSSILYGVVDQQKIVTFVSLFIEEELTALSETETSKIGETGERQMLN